MSELQWNREFALEQTGGDDDLLQELLDLFRDSSQGDFESLRQAAEAGDAEGVVAAAHSLKGAAASLGIEGIRALALEMETEARNGRVACARDNLERMAKMLAEAREL